MSDVYKLGLAEVARVLFVIAVLFYTELPLTVKILLIMFSDVFDCGLIRASYSSDYEFCQTTLYQSWDKIIDMVGYFLLLFYMIQYQSLNPFLLKLLTFLLLFRTFGVILFLCTDNSRYLVLFPNFFIEFALVFVIFNDYIGLTTNLQITSLILVISVVILFKFWLEGFLHN